MKKSILYRLFRIGSVPGKIRQVIESENIRILEEGISGWFRAGNVKGPHKRYICRRSWFLGFLAVTASRIIFYSFGKRQINILLSDPGIKELYIGMPKPETLSISFEASAFRTGWKGSLQYDFKTDKAPQFYDILLSYGASRADHKG